MRELGKHILLEFVDADVQVLNDQSQVKNMMLEAAEAIQATVLHAHFHRFEPQGITGILAIAESHLSIHTWPEYGYAAVDIFTCGDTSLLGNAKAVLQDRLVAKKVFDLELTRRMGPFEVVPRS